MQKIRKAFLMSVNPDKHEEYQSRHQPIWKALEETLKNHGASNYSIYLEQETSQLFAYVEVESEERWDAISQTEVCQKWWTFMQDIMPSNPDRSPIAKELKEVFHLD